MSHLDLVYDQPEDTNLSEGFRAIVARKTDSGQSVALETLETDDMLAGDVLVRVRYSSFNYKDGLALAGKNRVLRKFPIIPGIDYAGEVIESGSSQFQAGDRVVLTGWGVGENWSGGFAERARAKAEWLVKLPEGLDARSAMAIGTAGLTAMLCVMSLQRHGLPDGGSVVVSGASGGVGSVAVRLLSQLGYVVTALTGRPQEESYLKGLGASEIMLRSEYAGAPKPLGGERWDGAIDSVGGLVLANILANARYGSAVAACGLAGGADLPTSVFPFIIRNVALLGVDSVQCPVSTRREAWDRLAREMPNPTDLLTEVGLEDVLGLAPRILDGQVRGRTVVRI